MAKNRKATEAQEVLVKVNGTDSGIPGFGTIPPAPKGSPAATKRVRKPKTETKTVNMDDTVNTLKEWADWAGVQGSVSAEAIKYYRRRRYLKDVKVGEFAVHPIDGEQVQVLEHFPGSSVKVALTDGSVRTQAPGAEVEVIPSTEFRAKVSAEKIRSSTPKVKVEPKSMTNEFNIPVEVTDKGHVKIFGVGACNLLYWAGANDWDKDDIENLRVGLGLDRLAAENSIKNGLKIGAKSPEEYAKKFFTDDQEKVLETAAGLRSVEEVKEEPKPKPITKKDLKRVGK